jgi:hypothetical protein
MSYDFVPCSKLPEKEDSYAVSSSKESHLKLVVFNPVPVEEKPFSPFLSTRPIGG